MLVLFETPAGFALFKVLDSGKLKNTDVDDLYKFFETPEKASEMVKLKAFSAFENTVDAVGAAAGLIEGKMSKGLKKFLNKTIVKKELKDKLAVADTKLGGIIKEKLNIPCVNDSLVNELMRGIRTQMDSLLTGLEELTLKQCVLVFRILFLVTN